MARKSKSIAAELKAAQERLKEIEELKLRAEQEEKELHDSVVSSIERIAADKNVFIGVILNHEDLISVIHLALKSGEQVKIPFRVYFND